MVKSRKSKNVQKNRPIGATIVAIYYFIVGIFAFIGGILFLTIGNMFFSTFVKMPFMNVLGSVIGIVSIILGVLYLIIAYGLWKLNKWAQIIATIFAILGLFGGPFGIVLSIAVILLLWVHKETRLAFS
ncbi:hypothetical protein J4455_01665 [Candidatus Woesearchaeota archaeon]|nr:hypothetical protein [uncultured archaeon]AQS32267.1 hypothetical protein [uncultured archaeon]MBS3149384.1 hypothetical protein [Candidatus Woesearchaeota archaeon]